MDVEQISWAAILDGQVDKINRYAALRRINVVYQQEPALLLV